jgi:HSP20 family molecular chaperone IbpA
MEDETRTELGPAPAIKQLSARHALFERMQEINDLIALRAYELFVARGFAHGHHLEDWHRAESEILYPAPLALTETETGFILRVDVSGFTGKDLEVHVEPLRLFITGRRQETAEHVASTTIYSERRASQIFRVLDLPAGVDPNDVSATLSDGVLEVTLSKAAIAKTIPVLTKAASA